MKRFIDVGSELSRREFPKPWQMLEAFRLEVERGLNLFANYAGESSHFWGLVRSR